MDRRVVEHVERAQAAYREQLVRTIATGGLTRERCARLLAMRCHLGASGRWCAAVVDHPRITRLPVLRGGLLARAADVGPTWNDLARLGVSALPPLPEIGVWHAYFRGADWPFLRLGAATVLEEIGAGADGLLAEAMRIAAPAAALHGAVAALHASQGGLAALLARAVHHESDWREVAAGAQAGAALYLRMVAASLGVSARLSATAPEHVPRMPLAMVG